MRSSTAATIVMGTGIVSVTLQLAGDRTLSVLLLIGTAVAWVTMTILLLRDGIERGPRSFALVAATAVLGSRLMQDRARSAGALLLLVATVLWLACATAVPRARRLPRTGSLFLVSVSIQSMAVLAALLASWAGAEWLAWPGLAGCIAGILVYAGLLLRFDLRQLRDGAGDQWVVGGALAIGALAAAELSADQRLHALTSPLQVLALVVWLAGIGWGIASVASELRYPRLRYDAARWSTVFPVGMYGASGFQVARAAGAGAIHSFAVVWTWVAVAVWAMVAAGMLAEVGLGFRHPKRGRSAAP